MRLKPVLFACFLAFSGCTGPGITFHVVDASGQPLSEVLAAEQGGHLYFGGGGASTKTWYVTGNTGIVSTGRLRRGLGYNWTFLKPGYQETYVRSLSDNEAEVYAPLTEAAIGQSTADDPFIVVRMYRREVEIREKQR
jgi:hypothetical protein